MACPQFVEFVERGITSGREVMGLAEGYLEPLRRAEVDTLVLGCTHYPLVEHLFRRHLPPFTRLLSQPEVVADSLEDYFNRHRHFIETDGSASAEPTLLTTGEPAGVNITARIFWPQAPDFRAA